MIRIPCLPPHVVCNARNRRGSGTRQLVAGLVALVVLTGIPTAANGQVRGSRFLPLDHWSYDYIQRLRSRGWLENLNPMVQPYRRLDIATGLARIDTTGLEGPERDWVRALRGEFDRELRGLAGEETLPMGGYADLAVFGATSQRLDVLRPTGDGEVWRRLRIGAWAEVGAFAAVARLMDDKFQASEPDGFRLGQGKLARNEYTYLSYQFSHGSLTFGRMKRNWSTLGTTGVMVSGVATTYPQAAFEFRFGPFTLRSFTGELESMDVPGSEVQRKRYLAAHRVDYRKPNFAVSVGEAILYSATHGLQLRYLNPVELIFAARNNEPQDRGENVVQQAQIWYRPGAVELFGEFMLDDIDVHPGERDAEPITYALTLGSRANAVTPWLDLGAEYQLISAWAYRAPAATDQWSFLNRGLGQAFSDYDLVTLHADWHTPLSGLRLTPVLQHQRQGEGDFRIPLPPREEHLASPALFLGTVERTIRLGLRGRYQPNRYLVLQWDAGHNDVRNADHVEGTNRTEFVARAEVMVNVGFSLNIR